MRKWIVRGLVALPLLIAALGGVAWWKVGDIRVERLTPDVYVLAGVGGNVGVLRHPGRCRRGGHHDVPAPGQRHPSPHPRSHRPAGRDHREHALPPGPHESRLRRRDASHRDGRDPPPPQERDAAFWHDAPARDLLPNETFDDHVHELQVGGKTIRAFHVGRGHTDGDLVVLFVEDHVLHVGDLFFNGRYPNVDLEADGSVREAFMATLWEQTSAARRAAARARTPSARSTWRVSG